VNRRRWLQVAVLSGLGVPALARISHADPMQASFEELLKFGLKCRRPVEFAFVNLVVQKVNEGKLPKAMVLAAFDYARKRREDIPFPYFEAALRRLADSIGVSLDPAPNPNPNPNP
jgi:hypothetical protein